MRETTCALLVFLALPIAAAPLLVKVRMRVANREQVVELPLERYVAAALAGESSVFQSTEALKAMAVAARTYAVRMRGRHAAEGYDLCDTTHCQRLDPSAVTPRLEKAAADTAAELLWFQGKPAFTAYTRDCGGVTEDAAAVWPDLAAPYLKSHADPYCLHTPAPPWRWTADPGQIGHALHESGLRGPAALERISVAQYTHSRRASTLTLAGGSESIRISASSFRFAVGRELGWNTVRGDRYDVHLSNGRLIFEGTGEGHGVGLCQRGSEQMGLAGRSYRDILAFYYPGTALGLTAQGLAWQRLGGDTMSLLSTQPDQDRVVLTAAERLARLLSQRVPGPLPSGIEIRVYPDLETFRNATSEPGWVAAHTESLRIDLQPVVVLRSRGALESTLSHELLHVWLESQAVYGLPVWFREGLVDFLAGRRFAGEAPAPSDASFRQTVDASRARKAYADALGTVSRLVQVYGETTVLGWVTRGIPLDVTKANTSHEPAKSR